MWQGAGAGRLLIAQIGKRKPQPALGLHLKGKPESADANDMQQDVAMLFAPPLAPVRLDPGVEVTLGRSPTCELALPSPQASCHHAVVGRIGKVVFVRDLGSTNGTFVNGAAVEGEHVLQPGDQIEIGDARVTYCLMDARGETPAPPSGDATMLATPPARPTPQILEGDLAQIPFFAVLQMLEMGAKSGRLSVRGSDGAMAVWLEGNRIVHAESEKESGLEAALSIARVSDGRFQFAPDLAPPERSLEASITEIILEASRLEDESGMAAGTLDDPFA
jgi:pSer/pThr/pTyr-binding forkhead associated (FHA) protein